MQTFINGTFLGAFSIDVSSRKHNKMRDEQLKDQEFDNNDKDVNYANCA